METKKLPAWTYSQLDNFETCPKKFYHIRVAKDVVDPPNEHSKWGERVHTALEHRVLEGTPLPEGMQQWDEIANKIMQLPGEKLAEHKMAINKSFEPCSWDDAWCRGIGDLVVTHKDSAFVGDWKTGKRKPTEQLMLYAGKVFATFKQINKVTTGFIWLKEKKIDKEVFTRDQVSEIWNKFIPRVAKLESAYERDSWPARPSGLCNGWCPVKACKFYKDKK
jgi:hypothetical protein